MSKNKRQRQDRLRWCENELGGLGIEPCKGFGELAVVDLTVSMEFTGLDRPTIHLCDDCAARLKGHAEALGYDVEID
jgi:CRISPR/Cas system CMR-associated protein Cmr1 (group 7 of RAMP superfamily)